MWRWWVVRYVQCIHYVAICATLLYCVAGVYRERGVLCVRACVRACVRPVGKITSWATHMAYGFGAWIETATGRISKYRPGSYSSCVLAMRQYAWRRNGRFVVPCKHGGNTALYMICLFIYSLKYGGQVTIITSKTN